MNIYYVPPSLPPREGTSYCSCNLLALAAIILSWLAIQPGFKLVSYTARLCGEGGLVHHRCKFISYCELFAYIRVISLAAFQQLVSIYDLLYTIFNYKKIYYLSCI